MKTIHTKMSKSGYFFCLLSLLFCFNCAKKTEIVSPVDKKNSCFLLEINDPNINTVVKYDSLKDVFGVKFYNDEFTYPSYSNKLVSKFGNYKNFVYDSNNRLTQFGDISINYDSENRVKKVSQSNPKYEQFFKFEYDNDSNLKKIYTSKDFYGLNGEDVTIFSSTFDKQINPYYDLPVEVKIYILTSNLFARLPYSFSPILLFSKNNFLIIKDDIYGTNDISQQLITLKNLFPLQFERFRPKSSIIDKVNIKYNCP